MRRYRVEQTATGVILWEGMAADEDSALDETAKAAGYTDRAAVVATLGDDPFVTVYEVPDEGEV